MNPCDAKNRRQQRLSQDDGQLVLPFSSAVRGGPDSGDTGTRQDARSGDATESVPIEFSPIEPSALTADEAIRYLRLDVSKSPEAARASIDRLVEKGVLRPCMYRKERMFTRSELDRFLTEQTERYGEC